VHTHTNAMHRVGSSDASIDRPIDRCIGAEVSLRFLVILPVRPKQAVAPAVALPPPSCCPWKSYPLLLTPPSLLLLSSSSSCLPLVCLFRVQYNA